MGVVRAERQQITQSDEFIGRIQAVGRVALVPGVSAFLEKRLFVEGAEVNRATSSICLNSRRSRRWSTPLWGDAMFSFVARTLV